VGARCRLAGSAASGSSRVPFLSAQGQLLLPRHSGGQAPIVVSKRTVTDLPLSSQHCARAQPPLARCQRAPSARPRQRTAPVDGHRRCLLPSSRRGPPLMAAFRPATVPCVLFLSCSDGLFVQPAALGVPVYPTRNKCHVTGASSQTGFLLVTPRIGQNTASGTW